MKRNGVREQAIDRFLEMMEEVYLQMRPNLPSEWVEGGITTLHFRTITLLSRGPKRMGDIVAELGISPSTVTRTIDHLVSKEVVERFDDPSDRRVVVCQLTAKGRQQVLHFWQINRQRLEQVASNLPTEEIVAVVQALAVLAKMSNREAQWRTLSTGQRLPTKKDECT